MTIVLASALLSAIVLYGFGVMQETQNRNQKTAQIMYHAISEQQGQELYKQEEIAWVGEFFNAFSEQVNHSTVNFTYANADMLTSQSMPYSGDLPASENEIVVQESFLDSLGYSNELGQTIQIPFSDGTTHDFKLTGILDVKTGDIGRYTAIISKELVRQQYGDGGMIDYYIGLKGAQNMSEEEATNYANTLAQQLKISDDNVIVRSTYFNLKDENHGSDMLFYFLIGFVTFIGSGIVIYSIFYISVASSIRNYGQLRTIGTTKRQIKKMVYREGKLLAGIIFKRPCHSLPPPYSTILPSSMRTIRSARRAMSLLWVIITTVCRNSALVRLISPSTSALVLLSRLPVGSSASTIAGLVIKARAIATRCCCPPERLFGIFFSLSSSPSR